MKNIKKTLILQCLLAFFCQIVSAQYRYYTPPNNPLSVNDIRIQVPQYKGIPTLLDSLYRADKKYSNLLTIDSSGYFVIKNQFILFLNPNSIDNSKSKNDSLPKNNYPKPKNVTNNPDFLMRKYAWNYWKTKKNNPYKNPNDIPIKRVKQSICEGGLYLFECPECENIDIKGNPDGAQGSANKPNGGTLNKTVYDNNQPLIVKNDKLVSGSNKPDNNTILIAILDTGLETDKFLLNPNQNYIDINNARGFINYNQTYRDDNQYKHGSQIARIIIDELKNRYSINNFKILPLKILDSLAFGTLFDALDAICYAKSKRVDIINASWGFYSSENPSSDSPMRSIITSFIASGGKIVCSNGNDHVNLEIDKFYPACLSANYPESNRILSVTSLYDDNTNLIPYENYSEIYTNVGVVTNIADWGSSLGDLETRIRDYNTRNASNINFRPIKPKMFFVIPSKNGEKEFAIGTSYAAPFITAIVAKEYNNSTPENPSNLVSYNTRQIIDHDCATYVGSNSINNAVKGRKVYKSHH